MGRAIIRGHWLGRNISWVSYTSPQRSKNGGVPGGTPIQGDISVSVGMANNGPWGGSQLIRELDCEKNLRSEIWRLKDVNFDV